MRLKKNGQLRKQPLPTLNQLLVQRFNLPTTKFCEIKHGLQKIFAMPNETPMLDAETVKCSDGIFQIKQMFEMPDCWKSQKWAVHFDKFHKPRLVIAIATVKYRV